MSPKGRPPTVETIIESVLEESGINGEKLQQLSSSSSGMLTSMAPSRNSGDKPRDKRKSHRSLGASSVSHRSSRASKPSHARRTVDRSRSRSLVARRRKHSRSSSRGVGEYSSGDDGEPVEDHRAVLAAGKARLSSPSVFSMMTSLTTATDNSGGSSGSNSTVTQASMSKASHTRKDTLERVLTVEEQDIVSPAVPDPPDVFAYQVDHYPEEDEENDDDDDDSEEDDDEELEEEDDNVDDQHEQPQTEELEDEDENHNPDSIWPPQTRHDGFFNPPLMITGERSVSSSASSSFHDDSASEKHGGNDTDRSSSPERSRQGSPPLSPLLSASRPAGKAPPSPAAAKFAANQRAAQRRQSLHQRQGSLPQAPRGSHYAPQFASPAPTSPMYGQQMSPLPRVEEELEQPHGYDSLAKALTTTSGSLKSEIPSLYRKFTSLNHRYLLHLQDELAECEEQLQRLDRYRIKAPDPVTGELMALPGKRRSAFAVDRDRAELLHHTGYKLKLYHEAVQRSECIEGQGGPKRARKSDVDKYRNFLETVNPIVEEETRFLDHKEDLIVIGAKAPSSPQARVKAIRTSINSTSAVSSPGLSGLAVAIAAAVLVPILTFVVIPGFLGRMTVALLVAGGIVGAVIQAGNVGMNFITKEGAICAAVYGVGMAIVACVVG